MPAKTKDKEKNTAVVIALIGLAGTLIAALIGSPLMKKWLETPTPTATQSNSLTQVFHADFEAGTASGFAFEGDTWSVVNDKANKVLRVSAQDLPADAFTWISFGPDIFTDGSIAFRIQWESLGQVVLGVRDTGLASYSLNLLPAESEVQLGYAGADTGGVLEEGKFARRAFTFQPGTWYAVELTAAGGSMTLNIDGNRLLTWEDDRLSGGTLILHVKSGAVVDFDDVYVWAANR